MSGVRRKGYRVSGFRSDGFQVQLSFIALAASKPVPTNKDKLKDTGYDFPKPSRKVVGTLSQPGVFTVRDKRGDVKKVPVDVRDIVFGQRLLIQAALTSSAFEQPSSRSHRLQTYSLTQRTGRLARKTTQHPPVDSEREGGETEVATRVQGISTRSRHWKE